MSQMTILQQLSFGRMRLSTRVVTFREATREPSHENSGDHRAKRRTESPLAKKERKGLRLAGYGTTAELPLHYLQILKYPLPVPSAPSTTPKREGRTAPREQQRLARAEGPPHRRPPRKRDTELRASYRSTSRKTLEDCCGPASKPLPTRSS